MNKKQLAEMIKELRRQKLAELDTSTYANYISGALKKNQQRKLARQEWQKNNPNPSPEQEYLQDTKARRRINRTSRYIAKAGQKVGVELEEDKTEINEIIGKPEPFSPAHRKGTHGEDPLSSNQYYHVKEDRLGGSYHMRKTTRFKSKLIPSERDWQKMGTQKMSGRYTEETQVVNKSVKTDTGKPSDVIEVGPRDKNSVNKEINKENKEK